MVMEPSSCLSTDAAWNSRCAAAADDTAEMDSDPSVSTGMRMNSGSTPDGPNCDDGSTSDLVCRPHANSSDDQ